MRNNVTTKRLESSLILLLCLFLLSTGRLAAQINPGDLLPVEEAFALTVSAETDRLRLAWDIADGYYLYRHAFRFDAEHDGLVLGEPIIPTGELTVDEFFGETETYRGRVEVLLPVLDMPANGRVEVAVRSQ
ncbi:MAG: protein-disulfide reductase DsbD domain-containing protein, partial [Wenzhouxiangella sp.]